VRRGWATRRPGPRWVADAKPEGARHRPAPMTARRVPPHPPAIALRAPAADLSPQGRGGGLACDRRHETVSFRAAQHELAYGTILHVRPPGEVLAPGDPGGDCPEDRAENVHAMRHLSPAGPNCR